MYSYAVVGYFDDETEAQIKSLWFALSENNITQYGIEPKWKRPHITIADYDNLDKNIFTSLLKAFYRNKPKIDIEFNTLGTFLNTGTLFLSPVLTKEFADLHHIHHAYFKLFNDNENSLYLPGKWSPHCTIASRLSDDGIIRAFKYCRGNINNIYGRLEEIALIEIRLNSNGIAIGETVILSMKLD